MSIVPKWLSGIFGDSVVDITAPILPLSSEYNAVSFNHALETGEFPFFRERPDLNLFMNLKADDVFIQAFKGKMENVLETARQNPVLRDLLDNKEEWTLEDRKLWESEIASIASREMRAPPGFGPYRTVRDKTTDRMGYQGPFAQRRSMCMNNLSEDMEHGTTNVEFDCEHMSALQGMLMQHIENNMLPELEEGNYKTRHPYFYMGGVLSVGDRNLGGHAYIASTATGSVTEATVDRTYGGAIGIWHRSSLLEDYSFSDMFKGRPLIYINDRGTVTEYAPEHDLSASYETTLSAEERADAITRARESTLELQRIVKDLEENPGIAALDNFWKKEKDALQGRQPTTKEWAHMMLGINEIMQKYHIQDTLQELGNNLKYSTALWIDAHNSNLGDLDAYQQISDGIALIENLQNSGSIGEALQTQRVTRHLMSIKEEIDGKLEYNRDELKQPEQETQTDDVSALQKTPAPLSLGMKI